MITVGIPTKSCMAAIYGAIQSILEQTYQDFEILVVNDSGNPNSIKIKALMKEYEYLDNFRVIHNKKNLGIGGARNVIIDQALGDHIFFLSDDDSMLPTCLEEFINASKENPNKIIYSNYLVVDEVRNRVMECNIEPFPDENSFVSRVTKFAELNGMFVCYNFLAPTSLLRKHKFDPEYKFGEDFEHLLRCVFIEGVKFFHIPKFLFRYCVHQNSTTKKEGDQKIIENDHNIRLKINKLANRRVFNDVE